MVILESIYANISFGRNPEMDLLTPLARVIPWFLGVYGVVKIGDLVVRHSQLNFLEHPAATIVAGRRDPPRRRRPVPAAF